MVITSKVKKLQELKDIREKLIVDEKNSVPVTYQENITKLKDFCDKYGIKGIFQDQIQATERQMVHSLCYNIQSPFMQYKKSGNLEKTLEKLKMKRNVNQEEQGHHVKKEDFFWNYDEEAKKYDHSPKLLKIYSRYKKHETLKKQKQHNKRDKSKKKGNFNRISIDNATSFLKESLPRSNFDNSKHLSKSFDGPTLKYKSTTQKQSQISLNSTNKLGKTASIHDILKYSSKILQGPINYRSVLDVETQREHPSVLLPEIMNLKKLNYNSRNNTTNDPSYFQNYCQTENNCSTQRSIKQSQKQQQLQQHNVLNDSSAHNNSFEEEQLKTVRSNVERILVGCREYAHKYLSQEKRSKETALDEEMMKLRIKEQKTLDLAKRLQQLSKYKPGLLQAFYEEQQQERQDESETQRKVAEYYSTRKLQTGYFAMLEKKQNKRQQVLTKKQYEQTQ